MKTKSPHQQRIEQFMAKAKQKVPENPIIPDDDTLRLRASLILEEALETVDALGCEVLLESGAPLEKGKYGIISVKKASLKDIADGCADISVVTIGTLSACGIKDNDLLRLVDQNNLDKFGEGHSIRADGKLIKPEGHKPPDIEGYLKE